MSRRRATSPPALTWFDNRISNPVSNVTLNATTAQKQNLGADARLGRSDATWSTASARSGACRAPTSTIRPRSPMAASRTRRWSGSTCRRCRCTGVACRSRTRTRSYANVALVDAVRWRAVQRRSERQVHPGATLTDAGYDRVHAGPGCRDTPRSTSRSSRDVGRNLQVFFGVQNMFDKVSFVQTNPSTIGHAAPDQRRRPRQAVRTIRGGCRSRSVRTSGGRPC